MADQVYAEFLSLMDWKLLSALQLETEPFSPLRKTANNLVFLFLSNYECIFLLFGTTALSVFPSKLLFCWFYQGRLSAIFLLNDMARWNFQHQFLAH